MIFTYQQKIYVPCWFLKLQSMIFSIWKATQGYGMIALSEMYGFFEKMIKNSMDGNGKHDTFNILMMGRLLLSKALLQ